ncbi:MAG: Lon protease family protein [Gammaproteobacteria bacterium]
MSSVKSLNASSLITPCNPDQFDFNTTAELGDLDEIIGQEKALDALKFGIGINHKGYNLFVLGPSGVGKHTMVNQYLKQQAASGLIPDDWCYINNFKHPHQPRAIKLPAGSGQSLRNDMDHLIEDLRSAIPIAFESKEYHARVKEIEENLKAIRDEAINELAKAAEEKNVTLLSTTRGFVFAPLNKKGEVIKPEEFDKLPKEEQEYCENIIEELQEKLTSTIHLEPRWQRKAREKIKAINQEVALLATEHLIEDLKNKYQNLPAVLEYLDFVKQDVIEHLDDFRSRDDNTTVASIVGINGKPSFHRYQVNVLVDHSLSSGAPVIYEDSPIHQNLVGRVEHQTQMGALITDFTLIKPGMLHIANGGYLILDAYKVLTQPYAWEGLKRAIYSQEIKIQSLGELYSLVRTVSLEPEPIPLDIKIVLLGDRLLYYLLLSLDPDFSELFKVSADFEDRLSRNGENNQLYAQMIATLARKQNLLPFNRDAVAKIIEHSSRLVEDAEKLSTHMLSIADLLLEADYWARENAHEVIKRSDIQQAIDAQIRRANRLRENIYEEINRGTILIDTDGEQIAQVNGLSVIDMGDFSFAQPSRITATVRLGEGDIVDIEREVELGGAIHSKGVLILSSFLGARYAKKQPLSLKASLVFEQSYGMIDGDSASTGEACALLSALADIPIKQRFAITGSLNQQGQIQAIGGVNEKIEGFYDVCNARGLTGDQGVLIPSSNVKHLMLRDDVVDAVEKGNFHIYPVSTVDEAIELLTGIPAGTPDEQGQYPDGSINKLVDERLASFAKYQHDFSKSSKESEQKQED